MSWWFSMKLWQRVLLGLVLGLAFGFLLPVLISVEQSTDILNRVRFVGDVFIRLIRMLVVPLVFFTLVSGVCAMGDTRKLGSTGLKAAILFLCTTLFANTIGLSLGALIQPGVGIDFGETVARETVLEAPSVVDRFMRIIPANPFQALVEGEFLAIIFFSILFGVGILQSGKRGVPAVNFFDAASDAILNVTHIVMELAPFGVFALVAHTAGTQGIDTLIAIGKLAFVVYLGCILHIILVYGGLIKVVLQLPLMNFLRGILDAQLVAFSTSSSSATLPVTMSNAIDNLGVGKSVASSVLPLGATINMDGTALYLGALALFTAQAFGYDLALYQYGLIALTATLASVGTAGIPSASLFLLASVLSVFDVAPEHIALVLGLIFPIDRVLDMIRTATNVSGDAAISVTVAKWENDLDEEVFRTPAVE